MLTGTLNWPLTRWLTVYPPGAKAAIEHKERWSYVLPSPRLLTDRKNVRSAAALEWIIQRTLTRPCFVRVKLFNRRLSQDSTRHFLLRASLLLLLLWGGMWLSSRVGWLVTARL